MRFNRVSLSPVHWIYLVIHAALVGFGILLLKFSGGIVFAIGTSFLATGLTGWVVFIYVFLNDSLQMRVELARVLRIEAYFSSRGSSIRAEYEYRLFCAKENIDIMGFGQRALLEDLKSNFSQWKAKAKVRILLLDPEYPDRLSPVTDLRDKDEGNPVGTITSEVMNFVRKTSSLQDTNFHIRLYRCLPSVNIFRVDKELFWGPYFIRRVSRNSPTLVVSRGGELFDELMGHFDSIWGDDALSREVPQEWLTTSF